MFSPLKLVRSIAHVTRLCEQHEACFITSTKLPNSWARVHPRTIWGIGHAVYDQSGLSRRFFDVDYPAHASDKITQYMLIPYERRQFPRQLLNNAKTVRVDNGLVNKVSRCLQLDDGELSLEL